MHRALIRARHLPSPRPPRLPLPCPDRRRPPTPLLALPSSSAETRPCWFTDPFGMRWRSCRSLCEQRSTRRPRNFCRVRAGQSRLPSRSLASCSDTPSMCLLSSPASSANLYPAAPRAGGLHVKKSGRPSHTSRLGAQPLPRKSRASHLERTCGARASLRPMRPRSRARRLKLRQERTYPKHTPTLT